ncbi:MAG TPA: M1 family metallopeptidase, partial [Lacipirellulaceae bacterium]|nr:M1 family metallopeptidase [Lacipirellulaceae bacterium]
TLPVAAVASAPRVGDGSAGRGAVPIVFDPPLEPGQPAHVAIQYSAEPVEGLYFRTPATGVDAGDAHCWTQGEPHEARHWFPCFDAPNERATSELVCRVPAEMTVVSNGRLVDDSTSDDGATRTFHWRQDKPHVSYLICFVAGLFEKIEGRQGDVPLAFYAQPSKAAHAASAFRHTAEALEFFESATGVPYPWDKYDQAVIADFLWGGMENTTITTLTQRTLYENEGDHVRAGRSRSLNAHELAHQWFGNYVTCKDWSHLWLNEGFATYYALLYDAVCDGPDALAYGLYLDARDEIFLPENEADRRPIVYRQYRTPSEQFDFRNYPKASWVIHMLRSRVGDELYQQAIHSYLQRHALGEVETDNLRKVFEELSGQTLDRFFDQWLYHGGHPQLTVKYDWLPNERLAHISIEQTQPTDDRTLLFEFPAVVRLVVDGEVVERRIDVTERRHDLYVRLPAEPQVMRFDPHYTLLAQVTFDKSDALLEADLARDDDVMGRVLACEALGKRRTGAAVAALQKAIENDPFYGVRQVAARALREIGTDDAVAALAGALDRQSDQRVRYTIVDELGRAYHANATARLREVAADVDELPVVAAAAIVGLGRTDAASAAAA